jgi:hypothetical protein
VVAAPSVRTISATLKSLIDAIRKSPWPEDPAGAFAKVACFVTMKENKIIIGLSSHRPEMIPLISEAMSRHRAIFLEEPPCDDFDRMLKGEVSVKTYLRSLDIEYPEFSRMMCLLLRDFKAGGKVIFQVEPYLEILIDIHDFFADGNRPADIDKDSIQYPVYLAEKRATGALLKFYQDSATAPFEGVVRALLNFARMDAARFRLRDSLRAQELAARIQSYPSAYIEAGEMHFPLWRMLKNDYGGQKCIDHVFLAIRAPVVSGTKIDIYGPGDKLTLGYIFRPHKKPSPRDRLLAARALIHSKIIVKDEVFEQAENFPHLTNDLACNRIVGRLSFEDCRRLFRKIRRLNTRQAYRVVTGHAATAGITSEKAYDTSTV